MSTLVTIFRLHARIPALVLLLAILAPVFVTILPVPAMSAEQQLLSDISSNYCAKIGTHQQPGDHNSPADHHQCCILCAPSAHVLAAGDVTTAIKAALKLPQQLGQRAALQIILKNAPPLEWASPRGPPVSLSA